MRKFIRAVRRFLRSMAAQDSIQFGHKKEEVSKDEK